MIIQECRLRFFGNRKTRMCVERTECVRSDAHDVRRVKRAQSAPDKCARRPPGAQTRGACGRAQSARRRTRECTTPREAGPAGPSRQVSRALPGGPVA